MLRGPLQHDRGADGRCTECGEPFPCPTVIAVVDTFVGQYDKSARGRKQNGGVVNCPTCGSDRPTSDQYCAKCGAPLKGQALYSPQSQQSPVAISAADICDVPGCRNPISYKCTTDLLKGTGSGAGGCGASLCVRHSRAMWGTHAVCDFAPRDNAGFTVHAKPFVRKKAGEGEGCISFAVLTCLAVLAALARRS